MSSNMDKWVEHVLASIKLAMGIPPPSLGPAQPASFSIQNPAQIARAKAATGDKPKPPTPVLFQGLAGYSERGAPDEWDLSMGEVFGYRWWYLPVPTSLAGYISDGAAQPSIRQGINSVLYGANNQSWYDGRMEARCTRTDSNYSFATMGKSGMKHQPPETREACGCGFWAYFNKGLQASEVLSNHLVKPTPDISSSHGGSNIPVFGVVKGTGRVIIGEKGFRSQYAQITGLCIPPIAVTRLGWWIKIKTPIYGGSVAQAVQEPCSIAEQARRIATLECMLSNFYPSARIFTSQELLTQYFPPDSNYA